MDDLFDFDNEMRDQAEIKRLSGIIEEMRRAGIKLRNELSDFIETQNLIMKTALFFQPPKMQLANGMKQLKIVI